MKSCKILEFLKILTEYTSHEVYLLRGRVGKMPIRKKRNSLLFDKWYFDPPYPWNIDPPTHGIFTPLPMVF